MPLSGKTKKKLIGRSRSEMEVFMGILSKNRNLAENLLKDYESLDMFAFKNRHCR